MVMRISMKEISKIQVDNPARAPIEKAKERQTENRARESDHGR